MDRFEIDSITEVIFENNDWVAIKNGIRLVALPKYLYKYFSLNHYSIDSLEKNYLHLSNPKDFNDPFDCNRNLIEEEQKELHEWQYVEKLNDISDIGMACFSENGLEPLLWSHYTNSYKGFCIKFNVESLLKSQSASTSLNRVLYSNSPKVISQKHPFSSYYRYILKLNNWNYEREWRLLFQNPCIAENKFYFDNSCIEEISVGYKFTEISSDMDSELQAIFDNLRKEKFKDVPLMSVGPHQTKLELSKILLKEGTYMDAMEMIKHNFGFILNK
jgi:hypothetical protein